MHVRTVNLVNDHPMNKGIRIILELRILMNLSGDTSLALVDLNLQGSGGVIHPIGYVGTYVRMYVR